MSVAKPNSRINESYLVLLSRNISVGQSKDMSFGPLGNRELRQDAAAHVSLPHYSIVKEPVPFHFRGQKRCQQAETCRQKNDTYPKPLQTLCEEL